MVQDPAVPDDEYLRLKKAWESEIDRGCLEEALVLVEQALRWATQREDPRWVDHAVCALLALQIQIGRGREKVGRLHEILIQGSDPANARLAAYHLSIHYYTLGNVEKTQFYARLALDRAKSLGRPKSLASSRNQMGLGYLLANSLPEATGEFEQSLQLLTDQEEVWRRVVQTNLGYCFLLQGRLTDGFRLFFEVVRRSRRCGNDHSLPLAHLNLCFGYQELRRYRQAFRHGLRALELAERSKEESIVKNALYLLGETANLHGDVETASRYFERLWREHYPEATYLPQLLLAVDVRKMINLLA